MRVLSSWIDSPRTQERLGAPCSLGLRPEEEEDTAFVEVGHYDATEKWEATGLQGGLHLMNPWRVAFARSRFSHGVRSLKSR